MNERLPLPGFADGKDPTALRTIGEVAAGFGIRQHVLRYWEQQFPMLRPLKRSGGRRYYRPEDLALVETIHRLIQREGYTLKGARQAIENGTAVRSDDATPAIEVSGGTAGSAVSGDVAARLHAIRRRLAEALA